MTNSILNDVAMVFLKLSNFTNGIECPYGKSKHFSQTFNTLPVNDRHFDYYYLLPIPIAEKQYMSLVIVFD